MKKCKMIATLILAFSLAGSITACGNSKGLSENATADYYESEDSYEVSGGWGIEESAAQEEDVYSETKAVDAALDETEQGALTEGEKEGTNRKLIRNMDLSLETTGLDELLLLIEEKTNELGGYIESSTVEGTEKSSGRYSYLTVRIPADQLDAFEKTLGNSATVLSKSSNVNDVTLNYSDLAAHISSLRIEQETLLDMLSKADSVDTIITIQNELTNVRYELESYESQMKVLENRISYSTVSINIREVKILTVQEKEGFSSRVKNTFRNSVSDLGEGIVDFLVFFFGNILGILLFLLIAFAGLWLIRAVFRFLFGRGRGEKREKKRRFFKRKKDQSEDAQFSETSIPEASILENQEVKAEEKSEESVE